jgi:hypothetical protein
MLVGPTDQSAVVVCCGSEAGCAWLDEAALVGEDDGLDAIS